MDVVTYIKRHEGLRLMPYEDSRGLLTIGYGRCLATKGISRDEAAVLLANDIGELRNKLVQLPWFTGLNEARQAVVLDMAFNLGLNGFLKFTNMIAAIQRADYGVAADAMLASQWAKQVGMRAEENARAMRMGTL